MAFLKEDILHLLDTYQFKYQYVEHPAVYTIDEILASDIDRELLQVVAKNLFLRDDKKRHYYLVVVKQDQRVNLKELQATLHSRRLSFASANDLKHYLQLSQGEVTPLGLLNDDEHKVEGYIDDSFNDTIGIHPNDNRASVFLKVSDLKKLLANYNHNLKPISINNKR